MTDSFFWSDRHRLMAIADNADQVESNAIRLGSCPLATGIEDERVGGVFDDELSEQLDVREPEWQVSDEATEAEEGEILSEIERRSKLLGDYYPFRLASAELSYIPSKSKTKAYEFCLAASLANSLKRKPYNRIPVCFELLAAKAFRAHLGQGAEVMRTGWPPHNSNERPSKFRDLMQVLWQKTGEWKWDPSPSNPVDPHPRYVKDEGLDFIAWKSMPDSRPGKLFVLGQCACGTDWSEKLEEISLTKLERWFRRPTAAPFQKAFALPRSISGFHVFGEMNARGGIVLDRHRLTAIAEQNYSEFSEWQEEATKLLELILPR